MMKMLSQRILPGFLRRVRRAMVPAALGVALSLATAQEGTVGAVGTAGRVGTEGTVTVEFLPPPMEGTISLGVYDKSGKLVRTLHQEAELEEFRIALNGLVTRWDGKDDSGEECPGGSYRIRGYRVGELEIEGIAFHGNDWAAHDDGPRLIAIRRIAAQPGGDLVFEATVPGSEEPQIFAFAQEADEWVAKRLPEGSALPEAALDGWSVDTLERREGAEEGEQRLLRLRSGDGSREMVIPLVSKRNPKPPVVSIANNRLFLLEENDAGQELRGFDLPTPAKEDDATTVWRSPSQLFSQMILHSQTFEQVGHRLKFPDGTPFTAKEVLPVTLIDNQLTNKKRPKLALRLLIDAEGAYFATDDGLPLARVSETPHLQWAVMGRAEKGNAVVIFESDGAAIEEYRAMRLSRMMAFDAGEFQLKRAAKKPEATPMPTPLPTSSPTPESTPEALPSPSSLLEEEAAGDEADVDGP